MKLIKLKLQIKISLELCKLLLDIYMSCEKNGLASKQNNMLNNYYTSLVNVYNKNDDSLEKNH